MTIFWLLVVLLGVALGGTLLFVSGYLFSEEREMIQEAEKKIERGREEEAVSILSRVTELNPANFQARWRLAKLLQMLGQEGAAAYHFEFCLEQDALPGHVRPQDAFVRLAEVYEKQGHYEDAADAWSRYLQENPDGPEGYFRRAQMFYRMGSYKRALADLEHIRAEFDAEEQPETIALFLGRIYVRLDQPERAYSYYDEYLNQEPDDLEAAIEAARPARESDQFDEARRMYNHVRERSSGDLYIEATLRIVRLALEQGEDEEMHSHLDELRQMRRAGDLSEEQKLHCDYLEAKSLERQGQRGAAMENYWEIYKTQPDFLDVPRIIDEEIGRMDSEDLLDEFMNTGRQRFAERAQDIVEMMGYEVMSSEAYGPYEVNVSAREVGEGLKADRILVTFKRWGSEVGEWPLREFELQLLEKRYDRGIFVAPHGFKKRAHQYADDSSIRLIGPDTLIEYLREVYKLTS